MYRKLITGGGLITASSVYQQLIGVIVVGIMAEYLSPSDFGLVAMVVLFNAFVAMAANIGFGQAIINQTHVTQKQLSTLFWLGVMLGLVAMGIIYLASPLASIYFNRSELPELVMLASVVLIIRPLFIIQRRLYEKEMCFATLAIVDIVVVTLSGVVAVVMAIYGYGVVALISQAIALNIFYLLAFCLLNKWRAGFLFSISSVYPMLIYSLCYKIGDTLSFFERNIDILILTKMLDVVSVGYYSFVIRIISAPVKRVSQVVVTVLFPYFSSIKNDSHLDKFIAMTNISILTVIPLMIVISENSAFLVEMAFGDKWSATAEYFSIMSIACGFQALDIFLNVYFPAINREKEFARLSFVKFLLTSSFIFVGASFGVYYACVAYLVVKIVNYLVGIFYLASCSSEDSKSLLSILYTFSYLGFVTIPVAYFFSFEKPGYENISVMTFCFVVCLLLYFFFRKTLGSFNSKECKKNEA